MWSLWKLNGLYRWSSNTLATWCKELTHWKRPWCWERLRVGGEGGDRRWDGWMASWTQSTWIWANSRRQWRTGEPGAQQSMGSQRVGRDLSTERQQSLPLHHLYLQELGSTLFHAWHEKNEHTTCPLAPGFYNPGTTGWGDTQHNSCPCDPLNDTANQFKTWSFTIFLLPLRLTPNNEMCSLARWKQANKQDIASFNLVVSI